MNYDTLSTPNKKSVREIASLLDNHFVSNVFWEQLSSTMPNLPTLHLINSYKEKLDAMSTVFNTPGKSPGAQVFFVQELQLAIAEFAVDRGPDG